MVKVKFPDGIREVPSSIVVEDSYFDFQGLGRVPTVTKDVPLPIEGYQFLEVICKDYKWVAYKRYEK